MAQIQALDGSLEHAIDAYNLANERLDAIRGDLDENRVDLGSPPTTSTAQRVLAARMVAIYTTDQNDSTLDVLVGSQQPGGARRRARGGLACLGPGLRRPLGREAVPHRHAPGAHAAPPRA